MKIHTSLSSKFATLRYLVLCGFVAHAGAQTSFAASADGNNWYATSTGVTANINQVSAVSKDFVVASGANGTLLLYQNGAWSSFTGWNTYKSTNTPFGAWVNTSNMYVSAVSENEVWIGSYASQGNILSWKNGTFTTIGMGATQRVLRMDSFKRTDGVSIMFGMASNSKVLTYRTFDASSPGTSNIDVNGSAANFNITGVAGYDLTNMWAVGDAYLYRSENNGASWAEFSRPSHATGNLTAVTVFDSLSALAGTSTGDLFQWSEAGGFGSSVLHNFGFNINAIYAIDATKIWVAGNGGNLWYYDGTNASQIDLGTTSTLTSISGDGTNIWVAGFNGEIYSTIPEPSTLALGGSIFGFALLGAWRKRYHRVAEPLAQR
jgi:hypothetical protein